MPAARLFLVDGSAYVYRAFFALPPLTSPTGLPTNAAYGFTTMLLKLLKDAKPSLIALVFDAPGKTFRDELFDDYKGTRPEMPDELAAQWPLVHEIAHAFRLPVLSIPGVEADDVIGTLARRAAAQGIDCVVVTSDKDLMQLVGPRVRLWDTMKDKWIDEAGVREKFGVDPAQVADVLGLMGDSSDNIPGVKGIGEKTAIALVRHFGSLEAALERTEEVERLDLRGAKKTAGLLRAQAGQARMSHDLATIRCDVPLEVAPSDLKLRQPDTGELRQLFQNLGFQRLLKDLPAAEAAASAGLARADDAATVQALARAVAAHGRLAMACVATGSPMAGSCTGVVIAAGERQPTLVPLRPELRGVLAAVTANGELLKIGHDLKADIVRLARLGVPLVGPLFDCGLAAAMLGAAAARRLEEIVRDVLHEEIAPFRGDDGDEIALAAGVERLDRVRLELERQLDETGMTDLFRNVEMPLVEVLARVERRGVRVDTEALSRMGEEWRARLAQLTEEIHELAGGAFNIGSPPQLREVLFDRLGLSTKGVKRGKTGLSTDVDVLTRLAQEHPLPAKILEHRSLSKLLSTYIDGLLAASNPETGRVHTTFNQTGAATGRLSSNDPNLQNIPARGDEGRRIRAAFVPAAGHLFIAADYSQIELRVMAHLSGDARLTAAFRAGEDIHAATAAEIFGTLPGTVTPDMRRIAKVINFGIMYGMGPQRLAGELGIPHAAAQRYIEQYFERYPGVRRFIDATVARARETGYVSTAFGRRRVVPELQSRNRATQQAAERAAINMPLQGTAADLIKIAMVRVDRRLRDEGMGSEMVLQVHDELLLEVPEAEAGRATAVVREEMENASTLEVPLVVDVGRGSSWAEAH
jgi:DNA polymerase-1